MKILSSLILMIENHRSLVIFPNSAPDTFSLGVRTLLRFAHMKSFKFHRTSTLHRVWAQAQIHLNPDFDLYSHLRESCDGCKSGKRHTRTKKRVAMKPSC